MELDLETRAEAWLNWLNSTPEYIFFKDLTGAYQGTSKANAVMAGFSSMKEMIGKKDEEIFPPEMVKIFKEEDEIIVKTKEPHTFETWVEHPEKGTRLIETIKSPLYNNVGEVIGVQGVSRDITEKRKLVLKVEEQRSQLRALFDNIPFALWIKDIDGRFRMINEEYENYYGLKKEYIIGRHMSEVLRSENLAPEKTVEQLVECDKKVIRTKQIFREVEHMLINGEDYYVSITKAPILDEKGKIVGLLGISYDITEERRQEKSLRESTLLAETANRAKSEFLANMSHEIRTPMNGILGFIQLLSETKLTEEQKDYVTEAQKSSEILLELLNDILDLSKIEAGKMLMENISFNVRNVLEDVGTLASSNSSKKDVEINVLCFSDVPEKIVGDSVKLKQVLNNFINNAIKFTEHGEINVTAKMIEKSDEKVKLQFEISDTGIGISKEHQEKIFEAFTQADSSTTRKYGGTGLGLAISKNLVEMMNGKITLKSEEGVGSTFTFTAEFGVDESKDEPLEFQDYKLNDLKILVVDDNKTNLKIISYYLKEFDCETICVESVEEAINELTVNSGYDLILSDYCMPEYDGLHLAQKVREKSPDLPIILLSSRAQMADCKANTESLIQGYLPKPVRKEDLLKCINLVMNNKTEETVTNQTLLEACSGLTLRVLLVEDNLINQKLITKMLAKANLSCDIAGNGKEAIDAIYANTYDLVLMDCQMPVLDGYETTKILRADSQYKNLPIVALTANAMQSDYQTCLDAGMDDYLAKPLKYESLLEILKKYDNLIDKSIENDFIEAKIENEQELSMILDLIKGDLGIENEDAKDLLSDFGTELSNQIQDLITSIMKNDLDLSAEIAHSIKGAAGNLRINKIYDISKEIEVCAKEHDTATIQRLITEMKTYWRGLGV